MTYDTEVVAPVVNIDKLVAVYIKIRDAKDVVRKEAEAREIELQDQLDVIEQSILDLCKDTGATSIKTEHGTAIRTVKNRYTTNDWERFYAFMFEHQAPQLLERRIQQSNMKQFLDENPDLHPAGLNVDSTYAITVRRSK